MLIYELLIGQITPRILALAAVVGEMPGRLTPWRSRR